MAYTSSGSSSSSDSEVDSCSKSYFKAHATLKEQYDKSQVIDKFKTGLGYSADTAASPAVESFVNLSDKSGSDKGYHSVPSPLTGNFIPHKAYLTFINEIVESKNMDVTTVVTPSNVKTVENKGVPNTVKSNTVRRVFMMLGASGMQGLEAKEQKYRPCINTTVHIDLAIRNIVELEEWILIQGIAKSKDALNPF
ncbi:hypothetical protein Tco_0642932 [Tanacetum coccineum]